MTITVIPDIHGYVDWKLALPQEESDLYVFLGDYADSYTASDDDIVQVVQDVIAFDKNKVLLLGNHDIHYMFDDAPRGTGFRESLYVRLSSLYKDNARLFKPVHVVSDHVFSHAGISWLWLEGFAILVDESFDDETSPFDEDRMYFIQRLNGYFSKHTFRQYMFRVGDDRGGSYPFGGPFWCDLSTLLKYPIPNITQIVGHTKVSQPVIREGIKALDVNNFQTHTFTLNTSNTTPNEAPTL